MMLLIDVVTKGGWLMIPIAICSVFALGIILERLVSYSRIKGNIQKITHKLAPLIIGNKISEARLLCEESQGFISHMFLVALQELQNDEQLNQSMDEEIALAQRILDEEIQVTIIPSLEKRLNALDTLARGTPLLGLLGTVIGMIKVFNTITTSGVGNASLLAGGISEALITTAAGLVVAIPTLMFYRYFRGLIEDYVVRMEEEAIKMVEVIHGEREQDTQTETES